ncbi:MAG: hypothetical protein MKZ95_11630 [Pirellulales bacterium]|nr:hypothetical protein [Pirellulales bacterium]
MNNKYKDGEFCNSWTRVRLSQSGFHAFRKEMHGKYHPSMVRVEREAVYPDGTTYAKIRHASGLGVELRAQSYSHGAVDVDSKG